MVQNNKHDADRILQEIATCREDERSSQSMQLQLISIAGAVLGAMLAASFIFGSGNNNAANAPIKEYAWALSLLSDLIFITTFSYMTHLGLGNLLRYHYLQDLEVQLREIGYTSPTFSDWMETTAPVTTRNIRHLKHGYSIINYFAYIGATLFAILFCILTTVVLYMRVEVEESLVEAGTAEIHRTWATVGLGAVLAVSIIDILILFIGSTNSLKIYTWARKRAMDERAKKTAKYKELRMKMIESVGNAEDAAAGDTAKEIVMEKDRKREILRGVLYFIYPKIQDAQKMFLIVLGALGALSYGAKDLHSMIEDAQVHFPDFVITFVVIELLLYATRYQYNDIRGASEDEQANIRRRDRNESNRGLPRMFGDKKKDILFSLLMTGAKFLIAVMLLLILWEKALNFNAANWRNSLAYAETVVFALILLATIIYEVARALNKPRLIIFAAGFGYALRFLAGYLSIHHNIADILEEKLLFYMLLGMHFYGIMAVTLPWTYYTASEKREPYSKEYYTYFVKFAHCLPNAQGCEKEPLRSEQVCTPWNIGMVCCLISICIAVLIGDFSISQDVFFAIVAAIILGFCAAYPRGILVELVILCVFGISLFVHAENYLLTYLMLMLAFFVGTYFFLSYCFGRKTDLFSSIVGKKTHEWIQNLYYETGNNA